MTPRMITFSVGDPDKPSFTTVTGRGPHPNYTIQVCLGMPVKNGFNSNLSPGLNIKNQLSKHHKMGGVREVSEIMAMLVSGRVNITKRVVSKNFMLKPPKKTGDV